MSISRVADPPAPEGKQPGTGGPPQVGLASYLLRAAAASWMSNLLAIAYALLITPMVVRALQTDLYGVWSYLNGLLAYSNLFYLGLGSAFVKYIAEYRATGDQQRVDRLASVVFVLYSAIGLLCLFLCVMLAPWVPAMFATPIGAEAERQTVIACALLGLRLLFMFIATIYSGLLAAAERIASATAVSMAVTVVRLASVPLLLEHGRPLIVLATIMAVTGGLEALIMAATVWRSTPEIKIRPALPTGSELRLLYGFGFKSFFVILAAWFINYTDTTVIGIRLGAAAVAAYSIPLQLATYGRMAVQGMVSALLPRLTAYQARGDTEALRETFLRVSRGANMLGAFLAFNLVALGGPFMALWVGSEFAVAGTASLNLLAFATYCHVVSTMTAIPFFQAMQSFRAPVVILLLEAGANLWLSIWLSRTMGITGVAVATLLPAALITGIWLPRWLCRQLSLGVVTYVRVAVLPSVYLLIAGTAVGLALNAVSPPRAYAAFLLHVTVNVAVTIGVAWFAMPPEDWAMVRRLSVFSRLGRV